MTEQRVTLTPQMLAYDDFDDRSQTRWLPYLMYFHRAGYRSDVINTDDIGFRYSQGPGDVSASAGTVAQTGPVRLLAGSSTAFGIGARSDAATLPSRLWSGYAPSAPWLNFAGRSYNSAQEFTLFALYRHLLPRVTDIVVFSGLNNLALSRLPKEQRGDHGGFFNCGEYYEQMEELRQRHRTPAPRFGRRDRRAAGAAASAAPSAVLPLDERIAASVELTARHLQNWKLLAADSGARVSFVLQPLAGWVRETPAPEEKLLFDELDKRSNFWELYGDIATMEPARRYADQLQVACDKLGVPFLDLSPLLTEAAGPRDWLFVDRAHFTDLGHDMAARLVAEGLGLS
ncbi:Inducer of phenazine A [Streptomyces sp. NBC_01318]|uniref:SGNH/GDSL hydrolase family protein n=1 Tax=unclassified Streptomyces TaxID=2593676 RepID=UPI002DDC8957|nr:MULTISPECIES: Inducer of phenazine A [unclassified Streptomyces]WSC37051.1 Inducer of phenazine A [Streptomyces sp. NBC_01763]WSJ53239.1 Inducer of phenazine A [Streptomyces sp. NBC_01318]